MRRVLFFGCTLAIILTACGGAAPSENAAEPSQYEMVTVYTAPT